MSNDSDTGMVPVSEHLAQSDPFPADLSSPREDRGGLIAGVIVGAVLLAIDIALLVTAPFLG